uniref:DUF38 domain-containing protein n=1 Tax=Panagrolaimus sp. JU765 TaxID=591449 RepID=A0AC34RPZ6_9BILA
MHPLSKEACLFAVVRVTGLIDGMDVFFEIRSCKVVEHDCLFSKPVERNNFIRENLPQINFLNSDSVLKRRFYEICFPVIRRKLWLSSKKTGNLGKKPTTYLAKGIGLNHGLEDYYMNISTDDNIVFETKEWAGFADVTSDDVIHLNRHVVFNNTFLFARNCVLKMEDLAFVCNQKVQQIYFQNTNIYFSTILELLPNLNSIIYYDKLDDGWEKELWSRRDQLKYVRISPTKVTNFKILADLCRNGMVIQIDYDNHDVEFDMDELKEYFQTSETVLDGFPKPLFFIGNLTCYLKDSKMIELNNN